MPVFQKSQVGGLVSKRTGSALMSVRRGASKEGGEGVGSDELSYRGIESSLDVALAGVGLRHHLTDSDR